MENPQNDPQHRVFILRGLLHKKQGMSAARPGNSLLKTVQASAECRIDLSDDAPPAVHTMLYCLYTMAMGGTRWLLIFLESEEKISVTRRNGDKGPLNSSER